MRPLACAVACLSLCCSPAVADVVFQDDFNSGASPLWGNEQGAWAASGGTYSATAPGAFPNAHSSLPFALTDFSLDFDVIDLADGGVWLRSAAGVGSVGRTGVLLVTGGGASGNSGLYWHLVTNPNDYGGAIGIVAGLFTPGVSDPHLRIEVAGDLYSVFVNGSATAATTLTTSSFASGQVALYDNSGQAFDNVLLATPAAVPEPSALLLLALSGAAGAYISRRRSR